MPQFCGVVGCGHNSLRDIGIRFFRIPAETNTRGVVDVRKKERRQKWIQALHRADLTETKLKHMRICSAHFSIGKPAADEFPDHSDYIPHLKMGDYRTHEIITEGSKARRKLSIIKEVSYRPYDKRKNAASTSNDSPQLPPDICIKQEYEIKSEIDVVEEEIKPIKQETEDTSDFHFINEKDAEFAANENREDRKKPLGKPTLFIIDMKKRMENIMTKTMDSDVLESGNNQETINTATDTLPTRIKTENQLEEDNAGNPTLNISQQTSNIPIKVEPSESPIIKNDEHFKVEPPESPIIKNNDEEVMELENSEIPPAAVLESANNACSSLLPAKSRCLYERTYNKFQSWCTEQHITNYTETVLLAYFSSIAKKGLTASLEPKFSMLKATLNIHQNINIGKFNKLVMFIKRQTEGYFPKKLKVFEKEQVQKFILDAPNNLFLMTKVALIFGIAGGLRNHELLQLETSDVEDLQSKFLVTIAASKTKTKQKRTCIILDNETNTFFKLIRQYISLRPLHTQHTRFFIFYKNNICSTQPVGMPTVSKIPCQVAKFLKLDQPHLYTGHCLRRSSASVLADSGTDFAAMKMEIDKN